MSGDRAYGLEELEVVNALTAMSTGSPPREPHPPRIRDNLLHRWQASLSAQASPSDERKPGSLTPSPSKKRQPAQVVPLGDGRFQCSDGTIWPSMQAGYRHLKDIRAQAEKDAQLTDDSNNDSDEPSKGSRVSDTPERQRDRRLKVLGHVVDLGGIAHREPTMYDLARAWTLHSSRMPPSRANTRSYPSNLSAAQVARMVPLLPPAPVSTRPEQEVDWTIASIAEQTDIRHMDDIKNLRAKYLAPFRQRRLARKGAADVSPSTR